MSQRIVAGLIAWLVSTSIPVMADAPDFARVRANHPSSFAIITDRNHQPLQAVRVLHGPERLDWIALDDMPPALLQAVLLSEDRRFYHHHGVDWQAVLGAAWENLVYRTHRGASTLTMQLAGLLDPELSRQRGGRSVDQKWRQINAASELENSWSKAQILEAYLNLAPFRGSLQGVHAAAQGLFQTRPAKLDPAESAILAALLRGPNSSPATVSFRACLLANNLTDHPPGCASIRALASKHLRNPPSLYAGLDQAPLLAGQIPVIAGEPVTSTLDASLQDYASTSKVRIYRKIPGSDRKATEEVFKANLEDVLNGDLNKNVLLANGDIVYVPRKPYYAAGKWITDNMVPWTTLFLFALTAGIVVNKNR